jgi:aspartate kinase
MIVCKFGGTSVQDAAAITRLVDIIEARVKERPVVVVSALARVTDRLLKLAEVVAAGDREGLETGITALVERHQRIAAEVAPDSPAASEIKADGKRLFTKLNAALKRQLSPRQLDAVAGRGELWSSWLVEAALRARGLDAIWADAREMIVTDARFTRATPLMAALETRVRARLPGLLEQGKIPVTQGYVGATDKGVPTTLGRGGSDFTAALLGAALKAQRVEIWTDVDGLMTADPRIVPAAKTLPAASYNEAAELATFGAKVLHPATQVPLIRAGIPIVVLNSRAPDHTGTRIAPDADLLRMGDSPVRAVSFKQAITLITVRAPRMLGEYGFLRALFEVFEKNEVVVDVLASSEVSVSLTIEDRSRLDLLRDQLKELGEVTIEDGRAIVAVVGIGMRRTPGLAARVFKALGPINVEVISQGSSEINMTFVVGQDDGPEAVRRLHREFFGE